MLWVETPIRSLPYNAVIRTHLNGDEADSVLDRLLGRYRGRGVDFMWLVHPTATPSDLGERLIARGLRPVEHATGMSLELSEWTPGESAARVEEVTDEAGLAMYASLIVRYWEIPPSEQALVSDLTSTGRVVAREDTASSLSPMTARRSGRATSPSRGRPGSPAYLA